MRVMLTDTRSWADVVVHADVMGAPETKVTYLDQMMQPDQVRITYAYDAVAGRWVAHDVFTTGLRVLKPAADGTQRLGKDSHKSYWSSWGRKDIQVSRLSAAGGSELPEWLNKLVDELRPTGGVSMAGTVVDS